MISPADKMISPADKMILPAEILKIVFDYLYKPVYFSATCNQLPLLNSLMEKYIDKRKSMVDSDCFVDGEMTIYTFDSVIPDISFEISVYSGCILDWTLPKIYIARNNIEEGKCIAKFILKSKSIIRSFDKFFHNIYDLPTIVKETINKYKMHIISRRKNKRDEYKKFDKKMAKLLNSLDKFIGQANDNNNLAGKIE